MSNRLMMTVVACLLSIPAVCSATGYRSFSVFGCAYAAKAFEDERNFRKTITPPPSPETLTTIETREIAYFISGYLTGMNAVLSTRETGHEPFNVYPPGLLASIAKVDHFCILNPSKSVDDAILDLLGREGNRPK